MLCRVPGPTKVLSVRSHPPAPDLLVPWFRFAQFGSAAVSSGLGADGPPSAVTDRQEVRSSLATSQRPRHRLTSSHRVRMSSSHIIISRTSTGQSHIWRERQGGATFTLAVITVYCYNCSILLLVLINYLSLVIISYFIISYLYYI